jgi:hypothetical protein
MARPVARRSSNTVSMRGRILSKIGEARLAMMSASTPGVRPASVSAAIVISAVTSPTQMNPFGRSGLRGRR